MSDGSGLIYKIVAIAVIGLALGMVLAPRMHGFPATGLIAVTFPSLTSDIEELVNGCNIQVVSLSPPGTDPHSYTLDPRRASIAFKAGLVISTGHAPFEIALRNVIPKGRLVEINAINGVRFQKIPITRAVNPHMPIYDPYNYKLFIKYTSRKIIEHYSTCSQIIKNNEKIILQKLNETIKDKIGRLKGVNAVVTHPPLEYAVSWLGVNVTLILKPSEEAELTPKTITYTREILANGGIAVIMVDSNGKPYTKIDEWLLKQALKNNALVIKVPAPFLSGSMIEKILYVANQLNHINTNTKT